MPEQPLNERCIIAGFGGQGIMLMGQLIAQAGMDEDKAVSWLPSYGPEMRGGTANCMLIVSGEAVPSPVIYFNATSVIIMNLPSLAKFVPYLEAGGVALINSSLIKEKVERDDVQAFYVPCSEIASELGSLKVANTVMLGAFVEVTHCVEAESVLTAMQEKLGEGKKHLMPLNREAFARGAACVREQQPTPALGRMTLVIGYGNTLRGDDAFGVRVAEALQDLHLPGVKVLTCHQLTPELAEEISSAGRVLFIDASTDLPGGEVRWQDVTSSPLPRSFTHHVKPGQLVTLATQLYGRAALAQLLTVGAVQMDHGEKLSPEVEKAIPQAVKTVREWLMKNQVLASSVRDN